MTRGFHCCFLAWVTLILLLVAVLIDNFYVGPGRCPPPHPPPENPSLHHGTNFYVFDFQELVFLTLETPAWLALHGRPSDAQESFQWLCGHGSEAAAELQALMQKHLSSGSSSSAAADWLQQLLRASFVKPFLIMNVFFVIQQLSDNKAVAFYTVRILGILHEYE
jgi:hypothetical protein